ncbi:anti-sigma factor [Patescibacteria group bacterium]|nr:anti-sigma factor [Patescibacteria group bacterium]MBU4452669.1 anti-sigma factor [Patescibacteria group bacterium]MCG2687956.1 anti-sigma factor [Candidatus Parcubacteria bacterium]
MKYAQHRSSYRQKSHTIPWKIISGVLLALVVLVFIFLMIKKDEEVVLEEQDNIEQVAGLQIELVNSNPIEQSKLEYEEIELNSVDGSGSSGVARRESDGKLFTHVVIANLAPIETQYYFYEGWLVKPGITDFFSTGEMFAREDGKWGLVWEVQDELAPDDLSDFTEVVITLEPRDGNKAPSARHVLEGEFK